MFIGKQFDIVMGTDIHIILIPSPGGPIPTPIPHPFIGMICDPLDFVLGKILVNGIPRAQAGSGVMATAPHIPLGGTFAKPPSNSGDIFMGSATVSAEGQPLSYMGLPTLTCQDIGMMSPRRIGKTPKAMVLPVSILIVIPKGGMNISPTAPTVSLFVLAFKAVLKVFGKLIGAIRRARLIRQLQRNGVKCNPRDIIRIGKDASGRIVFLERGNANAGLAHILGRHADDFERAGIKAADVPDVVFDAVTKGTRVGQQGTRAGRDIIEVVYNGEVKHIAVSTGSNGFIVGANPVSLSR